MQIFPISLNFAPENQKPGWKFEILDKTPNNYFFFAFLGYNFE